MILRTYDSLKINSLWWKEARTLTVLFTMGNKEFQHLVHCPHKEDDPQLSHSHGNQTPEKDGGKYRPAEGYCVCGGEKSLISMMTDFWTNRKDQ